MKQHKKKMDNSKGKKTLVQKKHKAHNKPTEKFGDLSKPGSKPLAKLWGPNVPYSNQIANGDKDDDRELEDEDDPQDHIADDNGFVKTFKISGRKISEWERR